MRTKTKPQTLLFRAFCIGISLLALWVCFGGKDYAYSGIDNIGLRTAGALPNTLGSIFVQQTLARYAKPTCHCSSYSSPWLEERSGTYKWCERCKWVERKR